MTDGPEHKKAEQLENARHILKRVANDVEYEVLSGESGPLTLDQVPEPARLSETMQRTLGRVGWPSITADVPLEKPRIFASDIEFLNALRPIDEHGHRFVASSNFYQLLLQQPKQPNDKLVAPGENVYALQGRNPALLRANAAFPELFESLRITLTDISKNYDAVSDDDPIFKALLDERNKPVLTSMRIGYQIMARLIKQSDNHAYRRLWAEQGLEFDNNAISDPFVDPESFLLRGNDTTLE